MQIFPSAFNVIEALHIAQPSPKLASPNTLQRRGLKKQSQSCKSKILSFGEDLGEASFREGWVRPSLKNHYTNHSLFFIFLRMNAGRTFIARRHIPYKWIYQL
jgi:hypothetical protein